VYVVFDHRVKSKEGPALFNRLDWVGISFPSFVFTWRQTYSWSV